MLYVACAMLGVPLPLFHCFLLQIRSACAVAVQCCATDLNGAVLWANTKAWAIACSGGYHAPESFPVLPPQPLAAGNGAAAAMSQDRSLMKYGLRMVPWGGAALLLAATPATPDRLPSPDHAFFDCPAPAGPLTSSPVTVPALSAQGLVAAGPIPGLGGASGGSVFCALPLPVSAGLPGHINGSFELSSHRREIWSVLLRVAACVFLDWCFHVL